MKKTFKKFKIYLAGPDVFKTTNKMRATSSLLKKTAKKHKHSATFPMDKTIKPIDGNYNSKEYSLQIFQANIDLIDECDVVIANIEPFRGPNVDEGTAFEIGYAMAKSKIIYGYSNTSHLTYKEIYNQYLLNLKKPYLEKLQNDFPIIENFFGNTANLMIIGSIFTSGGNIFNSFEECIVDLTKKY